MKSVHLYWLCTKEYPTVAIPTPAPRQNSIRNWKRSASALESSNNSSPTANQPSTDDIFFTHALDMLSIVGFDGYFKKINAAWSRQLGYTDADLLRSHLSAFVHPDDIDRRWLRPSVSTPAQAPRSPLKPLPP